MFIFLTAFDLTVLKCLKLFLLLFVLVFSFADIDDCVGHACANNGSCVDGINSHSCNCLVGFTGNRCQSGKFPKKLYLWRQIVLKLFMALSVYGNLTKKKK